MPSPTLGYVAAIDVTEIGNGSTLYNIFFDSSITTDGNLLMFEYKLQPADVTNPTPAQITLGFINTENSSQMAGISNQWRISVPAMPTTLPDDYDYDPVPAMKIQVRVYYGVLGTSDITVTDWSNALDVHNPPNMPTIKFAVYDVPNVSGLEDLFVLLEPDTTINYDEVKFIVAYYYQDLTNTTVWAVSDPLLATDADYNNQPCKQLLVNDFGNVFNSVTSKVYTAVYAVFPFRDASDNYYYSVSHISLTYPTESSEINGAPTISDITYKVYDTVSEQKMTITWIPPASSIIPQYAVDSYMLQYSLNSTTWVSIGPLPALDLNYTLDVSNPTMFPKNATVSYRVNATLVNAAVSPYSDVVSEAMYYYSTAPQNLTVTDISVNSDSTVNMAVKFENPADIGSGASGSAYFTIIIDGVTQATVPYVSGSPGYSIPYTNLNIASSGTVEVYLETQNTNPTPSGFLPGASITTTYAASALELTDPVYNIYNVVEAGRSQSMYLEWTNISIVGWAVMYDVQLRLNGGAFGSVGDTDLNNFTYDIPTDPVDQQVCGNEFVFRVVATLTKIGEPTYNITSNSTGVEYMFKYSLAPQDLIIENTSINSSDKVSMTVNFENPSDVGCYNSTLTPRFIIEVNGIPVHTEDYHLSPLNYSIDLNNLPDASGTVKVYLETQNTNYDYSYLPGASITMPYVAAALVLDNPVYNIYNVVEVSRSQSMYLDWNDITVPTTWSLTNYQVQLNLITNLIPTPNPEFVDISIGTNLNSYFTYTIPPEQQVCGNQFVFRVIATLTHNDSSTTYNITSNLTATEYMFKYAEAPIVHVNWASAKPSSNTMDILVTFSQPNVGCGNPIGQNFTVNVYNASESIIDTQTVSYDSAIALNANYPPFLLNNIPLSQTGKVKVYLTTIDTNSTDLEIGATGEDNYTSGTVPIYVNLVRSSTSLTFNIISQTILAEVAGIIVPEILAGALVNLEYITFSTSTSSPQTITFPSATVANLTITPVPVSENYFEYLVTLVSSSALPVPMGIVTANEVGIGELPIEPV